MEFPGITARGGYAGTTGESSSFKHGFFNQTINSVEIVLANGDIVTASETENADLFYDAAGAAGTLGITALIELQLIEAKKFVKTTYRPTTSAAEAIKAVQEETSNPQNDYVDGILFSKNSGVVITGQMKDDVSEGIRPQTFSDPWDPWFYLHAKEKTYLRICPTTEFIPLVEYLFRYDRGGFWVGTSAFDYFKFPFNQRTRWLLDDFLHTRMLYRSLHGGGQSQSYIVQDLALPYSTVEDFINYTAEYFRIWRLWPCPLKQTLPPTLHPHTSETETDGKTPKQMLNIGLWGFGPPTFNEFVAVNRDLERKLRELGGMKWLYAPPYYAEAELWEMYDRRWYDELRERYHATTLPNLYEKVKVDVDAERKATQESWGPSLTSCWPLGGMWGIRKAIQSGEYLIAKSSTWKWKE